MLFKKPEMRREQLSVRRCDSYVNMRLVACDANGLELREAKQTVLAPSLSPYDPLCTRGTYVCVSLLQ